MSPSVVFLVDKDRVVELFGAPELQIGRVNHHPILRDHVTTSLHRGTPLFCPYNALRVQIRIRMKRRLKQGSVCVGNGMPCAEYVKNQIEKRIPWL